MRKPTDNCHPAVFAYIFDTADDPVMSLVECGAKGLQLKRTVRFAALEGTATYSLRFDDSSLLMNSFWRLQRNRLLARFDQTSPKGTFPEHAGGEYFSLEMARVPAALIRFCQIAPPQEPARRRRRSRSCKAKSERDYSIDPG